MGCFCSKNYIIYDRLYNFVNKNKLIFKKQYGFVKGPGSKDALNSLMNTLNQKIDYSIPTIATFLDLAKAFDSGDHNLIIKII